ncbi:MAG TPA: hypothetical protein VF066_05710 [Thermoleophilaceae bacterium]
MSRPIWATAAAVAALVAIAAGQAGAKTPTFDPGNFVQRVDNPWFPLRAGTTWRYRGEEDGQAKKQVTTVTDKKKTILGVRVTVVHDRVFTDGEGLTEDTFDWYAQDRQGNVWYLGEDTKELDHGRVTTREGSWEAGVKGARAGIVMPGRPRVGQSGLMEYWKGHAEDHFAITSIRGRTLTTKEWTPLEPAVRDRKVYRRGTGQVSEETVKGGNERFVLVSVSRSRR